MGQDELEINEHKVPLDELVKRFNTDIKTGLTEEAARDGLAKYGPNTQVLPDYLFETWSFKYGVSAAPKLVATRRAGQTVQVKVEELTLGDIVEIKAIAIIPADIRILETDGDFMVDNDTITVEQSKVLRTPEFSDENPLETSNLVFMSTVAVQGSCVGMVCEIGANTAYGRIAHLATPLEL